MQVLAAANDALRGPREVGGTNDVTVSNRVNLVDPIIVAVVGRSLARSGILGKCARPVSITNR